MLEEPEFLNQIRTTVGEFIFGRFVCRRGSADCSGNVTTPELKPVIEVNRCGLIGKARGVEGLEKPFAASVSREEPAGAVSPVCRRSQADDEQARSWITKARKGLRPVSQSPISTWRILCRLCAPTHQTGTLPALNNGPAELYQRAHRLTPYTLLPIPYPYNLGNRMQV